MVVGCQPYAPAAFTTRKYSWYLFLLEAEYGINSYICFIYKYFYKVFWWILVEAETCCIIRTIATKWSFERLPLPLHLSYYFVHPEVLDWYVLGLWVPTQINSSGMTLDTSYVTVLHVTQAISQKSKAINTHNTQLHARYKATACGRGMPLDVAYLNSRLLLKKSVGVL